MPRRPVTSLNVTPIRHDAWVTWHDDAVSALTTDLKAAIALVRDLDHDTLEHLAEAVRDEQRDRALRSGDQDAIISRAFDIGFGADGLAAAPWIDEPFLVCPGAMAAKSKTNYRSRFINLDDCWVWESAELVREDKRSNPGNDEGFRAVFSDLSESQRRTVREACDEEQYRLVEAGGAALMPGAAPPQSASMTQIR